MRPPPERRPSPFAMSQVSLAPRSDPSGVRAGGGRRLLVFQLLLAMVNMFPGLGRSFAAHSEHGGASAADDGPAPTHEARPIDPYETISLPLILRHRRQAEE